MVGTWTFDRGVQASAGEVFGALEIARFVHRAAGMRRWVARRPKYGVEAADEDDDDRGDGAGVGVRREHGL